MKILRPYRHIFGFYDGRVEGVRAYSETPNWLDDGAYALGICSFAIVDGDEALVYDTHISLVHARLIRRVLEAEGVSKIRVLLSHWHDDHVAGNEVFADCEIFASAGTFSALAAHREQMENASPPIKPLVMPNRTFDGDVTLHVGNITVEVRHVDIHSFDAAVLVLPESGVLLAGDTLEDPITYVDEPGRLKTHLQDIERMAGWNIRHILPNHGRADVIEAGGYGAGFIDATRVYIEALLALGENPEGAGLDLRGFVPDVFAGGAVRYFAAYEEVHERNVRAVLEHGA